MDIIVTDVTNMKNAHVCVAGWCAAEGRMVRPMPDPFHHWDEAQAHPDLFSLGNILRIHPVPVPSGRGLPHSREDVIVTDRIERIGSLSGQPLAAALAGSESASVAGLFGNAVLERRVVPGGTDCPSLGAIRTGARRIGLLPTKAGKLRCWLYDATDANYNFPIVSRSLKDVLATGGVEALAALKAGRRHAHIRLGLAHPDPKDRNRCTIMVNNILFF